MQKIQKSASHINLMFLIALLPGIILFCYFTGKVNASTIDHSICDKIYYDTYVGQVERKDYKTCENRWIFLTNKAKRSYINNQK